MPGNSGFFGSILSVFYNIIGKPADTMSTTGNLHQKVSYQLTVGTVPRMYEPSSNAIATSAAVALCAQNSYKQLKSIQVGFTGTITTYFELANLASTTAYGRIYKNGVAVGTERSTSSGDYSANFSENFSVVPGDTIELWGKSFNTNNIGVRNFELRGDLITSGDNYNVLLD